LLVAKLSICARLSVCAAGMPEWRERVGTGVIEGRGQRAALGAAKLRALRRKYAPERRWSA
jgi:hypothetical protein